MDIVESFKEAKRRRRGVLRTLCHFGCTHLRELSQPFCEMTLAKVNSLLLYWLYSRMPQECVLRIRLLNEEENMVYTITLKRWPRGCMIEDIHHSFANGTQEVYLWPHDVTFNVFHAKMSDTAIMAADYASYLCLQNPAAAQQLLAMYGRPRDTETYC